MSSHSGRLNLACLVATSLWMLACGSADPLDARGESGPWPADQGDRPGGPWGDPTGTGGNGPGRNLPGPWDEGATLPEPPPGNGDPERGRWELLNGSFMSCGIPYKLWNLPVASDLVREALGEGRPPMPGRDGKNADMPYSVNVFETTDGAEVINLNCLHCHGGYFNGELVLGLGDATRDFTDGFVGAIPTGTLAGLIDSPLLGFTDAERKSTEKILQTASAINGRTVTNTIGNNPADALAAVIVEHRDPDTLAWSEEPLLKVTFYDDAGKPLQDPRFTSDPPPWWRAHKKNSLFYSALTRGDHRGTMSAAAAICVDSLEEAKRVDDLFRDIQAYVESVRAPTYPFDIDLRLADEGRALFEESCAGCHGTYANRSEDDHLDTYPNLLIPLSVIGTDPVIAEIGTKHAPGVFEIYNEMFYGKVTQLVPGDPFPGYTPPPLDGVWATGPFLHNGSVPSIEMVLNSVARPKYWKRVDYDSAHFDEHALGFPHISVPYPQANAKESERKYIYDTTLWSQSNVGHTFGDHFTPPERRAVLEYLKTL